MKNLVLSFIVLTFVVNVSIAQNKTFNLNKGDDVFNKISNFETTNNVSFDNATRTRELEINPVFQSKEFIGVDDTILLYLFSNKQYKAYIDKIEVDVNGTLAIRARLIDYNYGYCIISTFNSKSFIKIDVPENNELFFSRYEHQTNKYYLLQIDKSKQKPLPGSPSLIPPVDNRPMDNPKKKTQQNSLNIKPYEIGIINGDQVLNNSDPFKSTKAQDIITLMILYTPSAASWASANETSINNTISSLMANAQLALDNSNTQLTVQLVHSEQVSYTELNSSDDLYNLTDPSDGIIDNVHTLRDTYCADVVVLLENISFTGGLGWGLSSATGDPDYAFSLCRVQQVSWSYTAIHEIGHNIGCGHHVSQLVQPGPGIYSYSGGWRWGSSTVKYCSVMTYSSGSSFSDGIEATEVALFSNPSLQDHGYTAGNATSGDNARTIRELKSVIADYRSGCNGCDTLTNILYDDVLTLYGFGAGQWGTWTGHNSYSMTEFAEYYTGLTNPNITGLQLYIGQAFSGGTGGNHKVTFKVYQGGGATPGAVLGSKDIAISSLTPYDINYIEFDTPVTFTGSDVYVGYQIYYNTPTDTLNVVQVENRASSINSGFLKYNNTWYSFPDISDPGIFTSIVVDPIVCGCTIMPTAAGTITGATTVCQGQNSVTYTIPAIANATSYVWTLPGGATGTSSTNSITVNFSTSATSGNITVYGHNECGDGASSSKPIVVKNKPPTPTISQNGNILHSNATSGNQWYNSSGLISGATNQDYTVTSNGDYYVIVSLNGCSSNHSNTIHITNSGIESIVENKTIKVYPNPVSNELIIEIEGNKETISFEIYNSIGQNIFNGNLKEKTIIQTANFPSGVYLIKLENGKSFEFKKILKE